MSIQKAAGVALIAGSFFLIGSGATIGLSSEYKANELRDNYVGFRLENDLKERISIRDSMTLNPETAERYRALNARYEAIRDTEDFRAAEVQYNLYRRSVDDGITYMLLGVPLFILGLVGLSWEMFRDAYNRTAELRSD